MSIAETAAKPRSGEIPDAQQPTADIVIPEHVDDWDQYFLHIALTVSIKSKDSTRVGAVIASPSNVLLSTGFNGLARGVYDDEKILDNRDEKLKVICHAEQNAIVNAARIGGHALDGATIFVTKFPCLACCNNIVQAGIKRIYTHDRWYWNHDPFDPDHSLKRSIIRQTHLKVDAPFHPEYSPQNPIDLPKKKKSGSVPAISSIVMKTE